MWEFEIGVRRLGGYDYRTDCGDGSRLVELRHGLETFVKLHRAQSLGSCANASVAWHPAWSIVGTGLVL